jgi:acylglycerol lipase
MQTRQMTSPGIGGLDLHCQAWLPDGPPRAVIVAAHGLAEHSGRYARVAADLVAQRYGVYAIDHRGHGRSPGERANIGRFEYVVSDFCTFAGRTVRQHVDTPVLLLGHSMGGAVAFASALRLQGTIHGLVLSAPALGLVEPPPPLQRLLAQALSVFAPNAGAMQLQPRHISRDAAVVREYEADPLVHHGPVPARTVVELLRAMESFEWQAMQLRLPTLVLHGTADRLVPIAGAMPVWEAIEPRYRTVREYDGLYHEVLNEPERAQVLRDLLQWLAGV